MLLTDLLSNRSKPKEDPNASPHTEYAPSWGYSTASGERVTVEGARSIATAYRAANIIGDDISKMPFQMIRRIGRRVEQVEPDPVTRNMAYLLQVSPNLWGWTPAQFKKQVTDWKLWYGNAYIWSPVIGPRQLLILPANKTTPVFDVDGNLWYRHEFSNGRMEYIPAVEILHLMINPDTTGFVGRGVITYARETFGRQLGARKSQAKMYASGFMPAAYIQMAGELNAEARNKVRLAYEESMGGAENAYRLAVFDNKITKFEPVQMQLRDQQFLESIEANDRDIANFFGLPEHMLNRGKEAYNSNEQKYIEYLTGTLDAHLVPWEEAARIRWLSRREQADTYFRFVRESLLRMDSKARAEKNEIEIRSGQRTPNEAREKNDMSASDDPYADRLFMASNIVPLGGQNEQDQNK